MLVWLLVAAAAIIFLVLWVRAVIDVWSRRPDLSGGAKAAWTIIMLILPFIGLLLYTMLRPSSPAA